MDDYTMSDKDQCRSQFEKAIGWTPTPDCYFDKTQDVHRQWTIWQAAWSHQSAALAAKDAEIARLTGIVSSQATEIRALGEALSGLTNLVAGTGFADSPEFDRAMAASEFIGTSNGEPILPDAPILADARRWWMLPAFIEDFQIDYFGLKRAIDAELFALSQPSLQEGK